MVFTQAKQGFTLIELLVVVLIIGILAAVALPQYQAAVDKAHVATYLNLAAKVRDAQNAYYLANGKYAASLDDLDLDFSVSQHCNNIVNDGTNWYAFNCKYGVGLDNTSGGKEKVFSIFFCPSQVNKTNTTYVNCWSTYSAYISFYYNTHDEAGKIGCISKDKRGARICSQFN